MTAYFFDSSALVKRFSREVGSSWILSIIRPSANNFLAISVITGVEVVAELTRKSRGGSLAARKYENALLRLESELTNRYFVADLTNSVVKSAMALAKKHGLRGYDAVQLAACLEVARNREANGLSSLIFLTADNDLLKAADAEGVTVENPNDHP
ncbi:MAG: type II toxin-antitoxin system VapC family toxin [Pyrinomonadaceae bacterium]